MSTDTFVGAGRHHGSRDPGAAVVSGSGVWLQRADGTRLLDASNTGGPLGHAHPAMVEAVSAAAAGPVANEGKQWHDREMAALELIEHAFGGEDWVGGVRFGLSGSEVNDIALSLAQAVTGREPLVARERAYHGLVGLSRDVTVQPQWHGGLSDLDGSVRPPLTRAPVRIVPGPGGTVWRRDGAPDPVVEPAVVRDAVDDAAAVIIDYTQGAQYHDARYQDVVADEARAAGALWIADEVVTGLGRSGRWMGFHGGTARPDVVTLGKPLAGGAAAAGAVVLSRELLEVLDAAKWQNYSTFRAHPITVAAVRAHLKVVREDGLVHRAEVLGRRLGEGLVQLAERHDCVVRVAGEGLHWTLEVDGPDWRTWRSTTQTRQPSDRIVAAAAERGVALSTSDEPTSVFIAPPLVIEEKEIDMVLGAVAAGLTCLDRGASS